MIDLLIMYSVCTGMFTVHSFVPRPPSEYSQGCSPGDSPCIFIRQGVSADLRSRLTSRQQTLWLLQLVVFSV